MIPDHIAKQLADVLRLLIPHIPPTAIDGKKATTHRISDCYLNDAALAALAAYDAAVKEPVRVTLPPYHTNITSGRWLSATESARNSAIDECREMLKAQGVEVEQ